MFKMSATFFMVHSVLLKICEQFALDLDVKFNSSKSMVKPGFHYPSWRPELTGDRFQLPVNTGRVDGRAFPLAELTGHVDDPSTRLVETRAPVLTGNGNRSPVNSGVNSGRQLG